MITASSKKLHEVIKLSEMNEL